jgi:hypothetical protein
MALFEALDDEVWGTLWYESYISSGEFSLDNDITHCYNSFRIAGNAARDVYKKSQDIDWAKKWFKALYKSAELSGDINPRHAVNGFSISGDIAEDIFSKSGDIDWAHHMYQAHLKAAELCHQTNPKHSAHQFSYAGNAAKLLAMKSGSEKWIKDTIHCYEKFLDYYSRNSNSRVHNVIKRITSDVYLLNMSLEDPDSLAQRAAEMKKTRQDQKDREATESQHRES